MKITKLTCGLIAICLAGSFFLKGQAIAQQRDYHFDRTISREVLENYLSRSITMEGLLQWAG